MIAMSSRRFLGQSDRPRVADTTWKESGHRQTHRAVVMDMCCLMRLLCSDFDGADLGVGIESRVCLSAWTARDSKIVLPTDTTHHLGPLRGIDLEEWITMCRRVVGGGPGTKEARAPSP